MRTLRPLAPIIFALLVLFAIPSARASDDPAEPSQEEGCLACRTSVDSVREILTSEQWALVQRGEIMTSKSDSLDSQGNRQSLIRSAAILSYPAAGVWAVITDFESRSRYVPGVKEMKVTRRVGNQQWTAERLSVLLVNIDFHVINSLDRELGRVSWALDPAEKNDISATTGYWQIVPLDERRTLLFYQSHIESGQPVPGFIEDFFAQRSLPKMISGIRDEIGRRFPQAAEPTQAPDVASTPSVSGKMKQIPSVVASGR